MSPFQKIYELVRLQTPHLSDEEFEALFVNDEIRKIVEELESSPAMTKDHYGTYLSIIARSASVTGRMFTALTLWKSGANERGLAMALFHAV